LQLILRNAAQMSSDLIIVRRRGQRTRWVVATSAVSRARCIPCADGCPDRPTQNRKFDSERERSRIDEIMNPGELK